jgi:hypothetical protein
MQKIPGYFPDKREFWCGNGFVSNCILTISGWRARVLALSLLDKLDARVTMATVGNADPAGSVGVEAF